MPDDTYAQILADAKRDRDAAAKRLLGIRQGHYEPTDMTREEAEQIEEKKIRELSGVIDNLGFRDNA